MRIMYWSLSVGLQVRKVLGVGDGEEGQEHTFVVHVDPQFVGPRQDGVPRLMRVSEFAEMMGWAAGPSRPAIFGGRLKRNSNRRNRR